jgi:hypothetical protein
MPVKPKNFIQRRCEVTHCCQFRKLFKDREVQGIMSNLEQIEAAILSLPSSEFERLRLWLFDLDYDRWDQQLEQDIADSKLDAQLRRRSLL